MILDVFFEKLSKRKNIEVFGSVAQFSKKMKISPYTLYSLLSGSNSVSADQLTKVCKLIKMDLYLFMVAIKEPLK